MKEKVLLFSLCEKTYPSIEKEFLIIDNIAKQLDEITEPKIIKAKKTAIVKARSVKEGEIVDTRPRVEVDGKIYTFSETKQKVTKEMVDNGAVVVINPDGEHYIIKNEEKFAQKYQLTDDGFVAISDEQLFRKTIVDCIITASWGEKQYVPKGSYICVTNPSDIYSVTNSAFESTYSVKNKDELFTF